MTGNTDVFVKLQTLLVVSWDLYVIRPKISVILAELMRKQ
jgi:hypothetical protein